MAVSLHVSVALATITTASFCEFSDFPPKLGPIFLCCRVSFCVFLCILCLLKKLVKRCVVSVQPPRTSQYPLLISLSRPPTISSLKITDRSFRYASPRLWNQLPDSFGQPRQSRLDSRPHSLVSSSLLSSPLSLSITPSLFHSRLKTIPFQQILPTLDFFYLPDCLHGNGTGPDLSCSSFYF